jgi:pimeloyl-ACP methyl ester carboxylesterase
MQDFRRRATVACAVLVATSLVSACGETDGSPTTTATDSTTTAQGKDDTSTTTTEPESPPASTTPATTSTTLAPLEPATFDTLSGIDTIADFSGLTSSGLGLWEESVEGLEQIEITSTADDSEQPALWLAPEGDGERPLLVILHSWSSDYLQHAGIPYAMWAQENGWAVIAPQFRGVNDDAEALGSDLAVQDVVDAIDYATSQEGVSSERVYAAGYSGGGMMSLLLAGRHPDKVTAVAAWGPPYDLIEFYEQSLETGLHYAEDIAAGCGGDPREEGAAHDECVQRSPQTHLDNAREEGVAVFIGQGLYDSLLSPGQGASAFNQLADEADRLGEDVMEAIWQGGLPEDLTGSIEADTYFGEGDPEPLFARQSGSVWLVFFDADHEMVYEASARFFASDPG